MLHTVGPACHAMMDPITTMRAAETTGGRAAGAGSSGRGGPGLALRFPRR